VYVARTSCPLISSYKADQVLRAKKAALTMVLYCAKQEAKETRDQMIARVRKEDAEKKRQRKLAEERERELWEWGGERPTTKEERRVATTEFKSLKQKLKVSSSLPPFPSLSGSLALWLSGSLARVLPAPPLPRLRSLVCLFRMAPWARFIGKESKAGEADWCERRREAKVERHPGAWRLPGALCGLAAAVGRASLRGGRRATCW
jgi:hypothetical protein